jgi:uncharacterized membrane protein YphA (DoxX/SURF4 family)
MTPSVTRPGDVILLLLRLGLAAVFIVFAIPKIAAPDLFAGNIFNYQMLPAWAVNWMAMVLPWLELFAGICLALGIWSRATAILMAGLMVVFMVAYGSARARGLDIACGCFEVGSEAKPSSAAWIFLRDTSFLVAACILARYDRSPLQLVARRAESARRRCRLR